MAAIRPPCCGVPAARSRLPGNWFDLRRLFNLDSAWFWKHFFGRLLFSVVPGSDLFYRGDTFELANEGVEHIDQLLSVQTAYAAFLRPEIWVGVVAAAIMIFAAIRLRRWRDEGRGIAPMRRH